MQVAEASTTTPIDLKLIREQFPALSVMDNGMRRIYFDNPAGTQVPKIVVERMSDCLLHANANLGGYFATSRHADAVVEGARSAMADFLNAPSVDEIIFGQNMTSLTLHLSRSIGRHFNAGDEVILSQMDHDANVEPWALMARDHGLTVRWLPFNAETFEFDLEELDALLNEKTRLVCVGGASNLTGTINDIRTICSKAREAGAWSYIDAVQSAPHLMTDVQAFGCDFFVCSAYKFFGPHQGILWGRRDVLEQLDPYKVRPAPAELPWCFESGTQSFESMAGTAAAVDYFAWIGGAEDAEGKARTSGSRRDDIIRAFDRLFAYEMTLAEQLIAGLQSLPGVKVQGITGAEAMQRRVPTVSFTHDKMHPDMVAKALAEQNIFVWSGHNYAVEAVKMLGILDSGGAIRVGPVHYNEAGEIDEFLNALEDIIA